MNTRQKYFFCKAKKLAEENKGKLLNSSYVGSKEKLKWKCKKGHKFLARFNSVQQGHWCPKCAYKKKGKILSKIFRLNIKSYHKIADKRKGKFLLNIAPKNTCVTVPWKCGKCDYEFKASYSNVCHNKSWCPRCAGNIVDEKEVIDTIHNKGGSLRNNFKYVNARERFEIKCTKCKHIWETTWDYVKSGYWCPECSKEILRKLGRRKRVKIETVSKFVESKGGKLLSEKYKNAHSLLKVRCDKGHEFKITWNSLSQNIWCNEKSHVHERRSKSLSIPFNKIKKRLFDLGFEILSKKSKYKNTGSTVRVKHNKCGLVFDKGVYLLFMGINCPFCSSWNQPTGAYENKCVSIFENIVNKCIKCENPIIKKQKVFKKCRSPKNYNLRFDWYFKGNGIRIAGEAQGHQHYDAKSHFHKDIESFNYLKKCDNIKKKFCKDNGILLIEIYDNRNLSDQKIEIKNRIKKFLKA